MCPGVFVRLYLCVAVLRACPCQVIAAGPWPYPVSHQVYCCLEKLVSELEGVSIDNVSVVCPHGTCSWELPLEVAKVGASRLRPGVHWLCHKCGKNFPLAGFSSSWGVADSSVAPDALAACVDATVEHTARLPQGAHRDESRIHTARALSKYVCGRKSCVLVGVRACLRACLRAATKNSMHGGQRGVGCVKVVAITGTLLFPYFVVCPNRWCRRAAGTRVRTAPTTWAAVRATLGESRYYVLRPVCEHPDCLHVVDVVSRTDVLAARGSDYFSRVARVLAACGNTTGSTRERGRPSKRRRDGATAVVDGGAAGTVSVPWEVDLVVLHERLGRPLVPVSVPDATAQLWVCRRHAQGYRLPAVVSHAAPSSSLVSAGTWRSVAVRDGLHTLRGFTGDDWCGSQVHSAGHGAELVPLFSASPGSGSNCSTRKWGTCASALSAIPVVAMRRCSGVATRASDTRCPSGGAV